MNQDVEPVVDDRGRCSTPERCFCVPQPSAQVWERVRQGPLSGSGLRMTGMHGRLGQSASCHASMSCLQGTLRHVLVIFMTMLGHNTVEWWHLNAPMAAI